MYDINEFHSSPPLPYGSGKKGTIMAERTERLTQNAAGAYYVDSSCVDCDLCRNTAPDFFKRDDEMPKRIHWKRWNYRVNSCFVQIVNRKSKIFCPCASAATGRVS